MFVKKLLFALGLFSLSATVAFAVYQRPASTQLTGASGTEQPLPKGQTIPALVSILDGLDSKDQAESQPLYSLFGNYFEHDCAGLIIANDAAKQTFYILTAAHCLSSPGYKQIEIDGKEDKVFALGDSWLKSSKYYIGLLQIQKVYMYKTWVDASLTGISFMDGDFAIYQVSGELPAGTTPITLAGNDAGSIGEQQAKLYVAGWGTTDYQDVYLHTQNPKTHKMTMATGQPNYAIVTSIPAEECAEQISLVNKTLRPNSTPFPFQEQLYQCAGQVAESTACYGDSGGPLFQASDPVGQWDADTTFTLYGNVSYSPALCQPSLCDQSSVIGNCALKLYGVAQNKWPQNPQNIPVPHVYSAPGKVLCGQSATDPVWYDVTYGSDTTINKAPSPQALPEGLLQNMKCS